ncbi:MAG: hypothetical protein ACRD9L_00775 [Bryobacteraceae bacterium]
MESFLNDLKRALRMFRQNPTFTGAAVAALALGIGTNTAIFSVVNTVLLKPVHAPEPGHVVAFTTLGGPSFQVPQTSEAKFNLWRAQTNVFQDVSGYYFGSVTLAGIDQPQRAAAIFVTKNYFRLFLFRPCGMNRHATATECGRAGTSRRSNP